jgi:hypothetical protein
MWSVPRYYNNDSFEHQFSCETVASWQWLERVKLKNVHVRSRCQGAAGEDTAGWKRLSVCCGGLQIAEISGGTIIACTSESCA